MVRVQEVDAEVDIAEPRIFAALREADALCETRIHMVKRLQHQPFCSLVVRKVQGRRVNEGETQRLGTVVSVHLNVDGGRADVGRVAATALNELGEGGELVLGDIGGDVAGIEEEAEETGLAAATASDEEGKLWPGAIWGLMTVPDMGIAWIPCRRWLGSAFGVVETDPMVCRVHGRCGARRAQAADQ